MVQCTIVATIFVVITTVAIVKTQATSNNEATTRADFHSHLQDRELRRADLADYDITEEDKRSWKDLQTSGWGKRSWRDLSGSGWGKRGWQDLQTSGWGKRGWQDLQTSGWGKRGWDNLQSSGWGKRAWKNLQTSGWGKRSSPIDLMNTFGGGERGDSDLLITENNNDDYVDLESLENSYNDIRNARSKLRTKSGKRDASDWASMKGAWGKRDPAWHNLKGLWGKRSSSTNLSHTTNVQDQKDSNYLQKLWEIDT